MSIKWTFLESSVKCGRYSVSNGVVHPGYSEFVTILLFSKCPLIKQSTSSECRKPALRVLLLVCINRRLASFPHSSLLFFLNLVYSVHLWRILFHSRKNTFGDYFVITSLQTVFLCCACSELQVTMTVASDQLYYITWNGIFFPVSVQ